MNPPSPDAPKTGSLFEQSLPEGNEKKVFALVKADEAVHVDELMEKLEGSLSSSEVFAALLELELSGRIRQLPGKNYVRSF
jgi:DNA processing protein